MPPARLTSWIASAVPKKCSDSETDINPVRENSTPTRQTSRSGCFAGLPAFIIKSSPMQKGSESEWPAQFSIVNKAARPRLGNRSIVWGGREFSFEFKEKRIRRLRLAHVADRGEPAERRAPRWRR